MAFLKEEKNRHTWICLQLVTLFPFVKKRDAEIISDTGCILQEALETSPNANLYYKVLNCYSPPPSHAPRPRRPLPSATSRWKAVITSTLSDSCWLWLTSVVSGDSALCCHSLNRHWRLARPSALRCGLTPPCQLRIVDEKEGNPRECGGWPLLLSKAF